MILNEDTIKRLFQENIESLPQASRELCPSFSSIARSFSPKASRHIKRKIIDHVSRCPSCYKEFTFLIKLENQQKELVEKAKEWAFSTKSNSQTKRYHLSILNEYAPAALVLLLIVTSLFFILSSFYFPSVRGDGTIFIRTFAPAGRTAPGYPIIFIWGEAESTTSYTVELYDDALRLIWKAIDISSSSVMLPTPVLSSLNFNRTYYWLVLCKSSNQHLYHSRIQDFSVFRQTN